MKRQYIDRAIHRQIARLEALLRDVRRSGGVDAWPHLFSHGHHFQTILSAIRQQYLSRDGHRFTPTTTGTWYLDSLDEARVQGVADA